MPTADLVLPFIRAIRSLRPQVIGVKENSNGKTGTVYVRTVGTNQRGEMVLDFNRWVMVRKGNVDAPSPIPQVPQLPERVADEDLTSDGPIKVGSYSTRASGSSYAFEDYAVGERINHVDGITVEEAEHMSSARLYQNTARVHFNQHVEGAGRSVGGLCTVDTSSVWPGQRLSTALQMLTESSA